MGAAYTRQVLFRRKPIPLPPGRFRMGGAHFKDDAEFIRTAVERDTLYNTRWIE